MTTLLASHPRPPSPAERGTPESDIDTPALLIDLDALEANMTAVHQRIAAAGLRVRPHGKAHKCPDIAQLQMAAGACGVCCQKASEAEVFAAAGIEDILITNQLVGRAKVERAARLAKRVRLGVCVDHALQVEQIGEAARRHDARIEVLIEVDIGHGRCGVGTSSATLALARQIEHYAPNLFFGGIQAFRGSAQHMREPEARAAAVASAVERVAAIKDALEKAGLSCPTVTGGGTGTYALEADSQLYTEVQPGSYVLMDTDYAANRHPAGTALLQHALYGLCTVISVHETHAVLDGGLKAFAVDHGLPRIVKPGWTVKSLSDEHSVVVPDADADAEALQVGDKVRLIPSHCDPTVNLHDWLIGVRQNTVAEVWAVAARGALF
jgi:D-serine deaminase-like pyridoxal phosphate-dependent protein